MKTTITLDTEVEQRLREAMQQQGKSLKEILNEALRRGLGLSQQQFEVKSRPLRLRPGLDPARLSGLDDDLEVEDLLCGLISYCHQPKKTSPKNRATAPSRGRLTRTHIRKDS